MYSPNGNIRVDGKKIYVEATSPLIRINDVEYVTSEKILFQVDVNYLSANVFSQSLIFKNIVGRFEKLTDSGVSTIINFPPCDGIELLDFNGSLQISDEVKLSGNARVSYWCENVKNKV